MSYIAYTPDHKECVIGEVQATYSKESTYGCCRSSLDIYNLVIRLWPNMDFEERFYVLMFDRGNNVLGLYLLSIGSTSGTVAEQKKIFAVALAANASAIVLLHNHPSGSPTPSQADRKLTSKCLETGKILELPVLDHIIVCKNNHYFSFADEGLL